MIDFALSDDLKELQARAREFAQKEIAPVAAEYDRKAEPPLHLVKRAHELGLMNLAVPKELGGQGLSELANCIVSEELSAACGGTATMIMANALATAPLLLEGTQDQLHRHLAPLCAGPNLAAFCLTEPDAGSDFAAMRTTARRDGDEWVISGKKCFITNGGLATLYTIFAMTDRSRGARGMSAFIVPADTPGLAIGKKEHKMGQRTSQTTEVLFDDMRIPAGNLLGKEGRGFTLAMRTLDKARAGVAALSVGVARGALDDATAYARKRETFGTPIINHQGIQFMLADMAMKVAGSRLMTWHAAYLADSGSKHTLESAMAKCFASDTAMSVTIDAIQVFGANGYQRDFPVEKRMRDAKLLQIYEGTNQVQRTIIARNL